MKIKGNGRSALILVAGLWVCFAGPSPAAAGSDATTASSTAGAPIALNKYTRHSSRHWRRYAHHRSGKVALKSTDDKDDKKAAATDVAAADADKSSTPPPHHPTSRRRSPTPMPNWPPPIHRPAMLPRPCRCEPTISCRTRRTIRLTPSLPRNPRSWRLISSTMSIARCTKPTPPAAPLAMASAEPPAASAAARDGRQRCQQQRQHLGQNLADREDLHRFWRAADDGLRCAHVHGLSGVLSRTRQRVRDTRFVLPEIHPT